MMVIRAATTQARRISSRERRDDHIGDHFKRQRDYLGTEKALVGANSKWGEDTQSVHLINLTIFRSVLHHPIPIRLKIASQRLQVKAGCTGLAEKVRDWMASRIGIGIGPQVDGALTGATIAQNRVRG